MKVTVRLGAPLSQVVGESKVILPLPEGSTVADVLDELRKRSTDFEAGLRGKGFRGRLHPVRYSLFLNTRPVEWDKADATLVRDGDRLYVLFPVAGGC